jgi:MFS family permease
MTAADRARPQWQVRGAAMWSFAVNGLVMGTWYARIPQVQRDLHLSDGALGSALIATTIGGIFAMQACRAIIRRIDSARVAWLAGLAFPVALILPGVASSVLSLVVCLLAFGAIDGLLDVSMNDHAVAVEKKLKRSVMSSMHAAWSVGGIAGAGLAGLMSKEGFSLVRNFAFIAALAAIISIILARGFHPARPDERSSARVRSAGLRSGWSRRVLTLGLLSAVCLLAEGVAKSWGPVFMVQDKHASAAIATLAYTVFSVTMTAGRIAGDTLYARFGPTRLVRASALVAVAGLAIALSAPAESEVIAGFGIFGLGMSILVPMIVSAAGHQDNSSENATSDLAIAHVATVGYTGILAGPVFIGWLSELVGLRAAMAIPALLLVAVIARAGATAAAGGAQESAADPAISV